MLFYQLTIDEKQYIIPSNVTSGRFMKILSHILKQEIRGIIMGRVAFGMPYRALPLKGVRTKIDPYLTDGVKGILVGEDKFPFTLHHYYHDQPWKTMVEAELNKLGPSASPLKEPLDFNIPDHGDYLGQYRWQVLPQEERQEAHRLYCPICELAFWSEGITYESSKLGLLVEGECPYCKALVVKEVVCHDQSVK